MNPILKLPRPVIKFNNSLYRDKFIWENNSYEEWFAIVVRTGTFEVEMRGKKEIATDGDIVFFPPGVNFTRHIIRPITILYINFEWDGDRSDTLWQEYFPCGKLEFIDNTRVNEDVSTLISLCNLQSPEAISVSNHYFCDIWFDYCRMRNTDHLIDYKKIDDAVVGGAVKKISRDFPKPLKIAEIAAENSMSHVNFTNRFSRAVGMTPVEYLRRTRLNNARLLLISSDIPIGEIARSCGFDNQFYFSRCFNDYYGMPPSKYRANNLI